MNPKKFSRIAESLRQYRRAELRDFMDEIGENAVDTLYVDPLPGDAVLTSVLSSNTTFLLGRKGTGKSTVFARAQSELRKKQNIISIYVDVKSLYDTMQASDVVSGVVGDVTIDPGIFRAHLLRKSFLGSSLAEILKEIDKTSEAMSLWDKWRGHRKPYSELRKNIEALQSRLKDVKLDSQELPVLQQITTKWKARAQKETGKTQSAGVKVEAGGMPANVGVNFSGHASLSDFDKSLDDNEVYNEYSDVVLRSFPFDSIISEIKELVEECGLARLVIFFDDFSELSLVDQRLFVDIVLAPLNNSSNESIKLKIAGYPGRVYFGKIDPGKVDTVSLDFSSLYEASEVQTMEHAATDYASRLMRSRFEAFGEDVNDYFDDSISIEQHMRLLFETTFNVPRLMGILLHVCYLDRVSKGQKITAASLRLAARKHYENTIVKYFDRLNRYALEPFENKLDRHNQSELIKTITQEAKRVRSGISSGTVGGTYFKGVSNPPISHFIVSPELSVIFQSLEANFLLSRYKETRDKNGKPVVVYAMFYGLSEAERIAWGYPSGREYRNYFVQRCFDFSSAIHEFLSQKQTIRCGSCFTCFPLDQKPSIELYKWRCPECSDGHCSIVDLADDFAQEVSKLSNQKALDPVELDILTALHDEDEEMRASEISALIDVTYQLVGKRTSKLSDIGLVKKERKLIDGKMRSQITDRANNNYFGE
ncbi:hypothetical protein SAMN05216296_1822 [Pseudomonas pohangensis]|uniref:Uncharacterized protein n=1 Tax=Pseudomonas pohangensis TaxID=364197 RepID=A0A1H2FUH7_9PSED|nr:transcriptional regulator [Pseudomonas pohangensis]SDU10981.1 hypothetical protein SAMN05216296_1822 [Pseudomonas pohangensis]